MKKTAWAAAVLALAAVAPGAQAATSTYNITTTWYEPDTQPRDSIFTGSFTFDSTTHTVSNLTGKLSESMTGTNASDMTWLDLNYQLQTWHDDTLGGTFAATFKNNNTTTFTTMFKAGDGWSPKSGIENMAMYAGVPGANPGNAYALIFVPDSPLTALNQSQIDKLAYADCAPGGMMMSVCMTGTSVAGYGSVGSMSGYPVSQTITAAVPEPETYAMMMAGLGILGAIGRRRQRRG